MRNKSLFNLITLVVFFNLAIPGHVLSASLSSFSRNAKKQKSVLIAAPGIAPTPLKPFAPSSLLPSPSLRPVGPSSVKSQTKSLIELPYRSFSDENLIAPVEASFFTETQGLAAQVPTSRPLSPAQETPRASRGLHQDSELISANPAPSLSRPSVDSVSRTNIPGSLKTPSAISAPVINDAEDQEPVSASLIPVAISAGSGEAISGPQSQTSPANPGHYSILNSGPVVDPRPEPAQSMASAVDFSSNFQTIAVGHAVTFAPLTTLPQPLIYQWSFLGGSPSASTAKYPVVTYNTLGDFNVTLTITSQNIPVTETKAQYIHAVSSSEYQDLTGKENNRWYFSDKNVFSFDPANQSMTVSPGVMSTGGYEGAASISNADGNLLFYGTPTKLFNRHHELMQNGSNLYGGDDSTQGILIIPKPSKFVNGINQNYGKYYVFTADHYGQGHGLRYSIVDMALDNGLGGIPPGATNKNVLMQQPAAEKLIAVPHANKHDIWIIGHSFPYNHFLAYLLTENGLSPSPVVSPTGVALTAQDQVAGEMAVTLDGSKIAQLISSATSQKIELFSFDNQSGSLGPATEIPGTSDPDKYGLEFSRSGRFLYYASSSSSWLKQIDLEDPNLSIATLVPPSTGEVGIIELGPDSKIYATFFGKVTAPFYGALVVNAPDFLGAACNVQTLTLPTEPRFNLHNKVPFPKFSVSGIVTDSAGQGIGSVPIVEGGNTVVTTVASGPSVGTYAFDKPFGWSGTVGPLPVSGYGSYIPSSITYTNLISPQTSQNYVAIPNAPTFYAISGRVTTNGTPNGLSNVTITASNSGGSAFTDALGYYTITNVSANWTGTLTASYTPGGYVFSGPILINTPLSGNLSGQDFVATPVTYNISGEIRDSFGNPLNISSPVTIAIAPQAGNSPQVITSGSAYMISGIPHLWSGTITAVSSGYILTLDPQGSTFVLNQPMTENKIQHFKAVPITRTISGHIMLDKQDVPLEGVTLTATSGIPGNPSPVSTDVNGYYSMTVPDNWSGTITASKTGFAFHFTIPGPFFGLDHASYSNLTSDQAGQDYIIDVEAPQVYAISGRVTINGTPNGLSNVTITASNNGGNAVTDALGYYTIANVPANWTGTLAASYSPSGYTFSGPILINTPLSGNLLNQNFLATPIATRTISGYILIVSTEVELSGITLTATNGSPNNPSPVTTDASGYYAMVVPDHWSGTITASRPGNFFHSTVPGPYFGLDHVVYTNVTSDQSGQNYVVTTY